MFIIIAIIIIIAFQFSKARHFSGPVSVRFLRARFHRAAIHLEWPNSGMF